MIQSVNPATEEVMKEFDTISLEEAVNVVQSLSKSEWPSADISERVKYIRAAGKILLKNKNGFAGLITKEMGKPITQSMAEIEKCALGCDYYAENTAGFLENEIVKTESKKSYVTFEPLGTVLGIMPWNFPFWQVFRFAIPALAAGNAVILKHASNVPQCSMAIEEIFKESGIDAFRSLLIDSATATKLIESDYIDAVSLTGSTEAGKKVGEVAGKNVKKVVLELGGSDPFIVLGDADIEFTCKNAVSARTKAAGQSCISAKRFVVVKEQVNEFEKSLTEYFRNLKVGDPMDPETDMGPLAKEDLVKTLERQVDESAAMGAKILTGGKRMKRKGFFFAPTVISNVTDKMPVIKEETFGPVAPIIVVENEEAAIKEANKTEYGLGASIWTRDREKAERLAKKIKAGGVFINSIVASDLRLPFGGVKKSGIGRELSHYGIKEFVNIKTVVVN